MANAKKCDRCKKYYTPDVSSAVIRIVNDSGPLSDMYKDLCNRCTKDFDDFMEEFKDAED